MEYIGIPGLFHVEETVQQHKEHVRAENYHCSEARSAVCESDVRHEARGKYEIVRYPRVRYTLVVDIHQSHLLKAAVEEVSSTGHL